MKITPSAHLQSNESQINYVYYFFNSSPQASSPDEKALVEGAAQNGVVFVGVEPVEDSISTKRYKIEYRNGGSTNDNAAEQKCYLVDAVLEFTSERKRMTVMVRYPDGTYHIHSKGAESTMLTPE
ncbi:hypothetical protein T265_16158, partial [Opisthorchis viverrini]